MENWGKFTCPFWGKIDYIFLNSLLPPSAEELEKDKKTCVTIDEWIDVWGTLVGNKKKLDDFPMWLQYYPKLLFNVINRGGKFGNPEFGICSSLSFSPSSLFAVRVEVCVCEFERTSSLNSVCIFQHHNYPVLEKEIESLKYRELKIYDCFTETVFVQTLKTFSDYSLKCCFANKLDGDDPKRSARPLRGF